MSVSVSVCMEGPTHLVRYRAVVVASEGDTEGREVGLTVGLTVGLVGL